MTWREACSRLELAWPGWYCRCWWSSCRCWLDFSLRYKVAERLQFMQDDCFFLLACKLLYVEKNKMVFKYLWRWVVSEGIFFAGRRSRRRSDSTPRDDSLPAANADCRRGGNKGTAKLSVSRSYMSSRSSRLSPHPLHDELGELKNLTVSSNMEWALGSEEEGKKRKQQGQDLRENIWRRKSAQEWTETWDCSGLYSQVCSHCPLQ